MPFISKNNDLKTIFITEPEIIDRYVGNQLWLWGRNADGFLGDNTTINRSSPVQTISSGTNWICVSAGHLITAAIKTDGTLWTWGCGSGGALGNNNTLLRSSPVQTISGGTNWRNIAAGLFTVGAIKTDGTLWMWGDGFCGTLGNNSLITSSSPVQTISGGTNWKNIAAGRYSAAATKTDGTLWLWGDNAVGSLGTNTTTHQSSPVQTISGGTNWKTVSMGATRRGAAAIKTDGTLWLWGDGAVCVPGPLANRRSSPVQVITGGTNWKQVSLACYSTAAIKTDGTLWLWGCAGFGRLGNGSTSGESSTPVQTLSGGQNWKQVCAGPLHTAAIKTDSTLWLWGYNGAGRLGRNSNGGGFCCPVQTFIEGSNWKQVSLGDQSSFAVNHTDN